MRPVGGSPPASDGGSGPRTSVGPCPPSGGRGREETSSVLGRSNPNGTSLSSGELEDRSRWQTSRESVWSSDPASSDVGKALERRACFAFGWSREKRRREGVGKPTLRRAGCALERRCKTQESIDPVGLRPVRARTLSKKKALKLRGIVAFWSSEQESAMSETARGYRRRKAHGFVRGESSEG